MPAFLNKAHNNVSTAELLLDNGLPLTSAHPAYYSVFLLLKYVLAHFCSIDYVKQDELTSGQGSHREIADRALPYLIANDAEVANDYKVWYNKLEMTRRKADYRPVELKESQIRDVLNAAKSFKENVEKHFINA